MNPKLKIVFALHNPAVFRSFERTIHSLCRSGHHVTVLYGDYGKDVVVNRALKKNLKEVKNLHAEPIKRRARSNRLVHLRELANYANYFRPQHPTPWEAKRWLRYVTKPIKKRIKRFAVIDQILAAGIVLNFLKTAERLVAPDKQIEKWLKETDPDIVVASPYILPLSPEVEYIKAARKLGISTAVVVLSWDNLTTKGTFHVYPDHVFVWNQTIATEAEQLHDVQPQKIRITGAPVFDFWFDMQPSMTYTDFCRTTGLDASKPYVLYLCSSRYIARDENLFVQELYRSLQQSEYRDRFQLLVRPHPLNAQIWQNANPDEFCIWPKDSKWTDLDDVKQEYFNSIYHSSAVVGINTSAFLESAILDKPCITIMNDRYKRKQTGLGHFQHLLDGNFIELTDNHDRTLERIIELLDGDDQKRDNRLRFIRNFIRPAGMDKQASEVMAETIQRSAIDKALQ